MEWLNYHHLHYFWMAAREGSVSRASALLRLAQPTVSAQIRQLEGSLGTKLFQRQGRSLVLTDTGRLVYQFADEIFGIGRELIETVHGRQAGRSRPLAVGVANAVPKLIVSRLLRPLLLGPDPIRVVCREDNTEHLLAQLATHSLDVVIADVVAPPHVRVKVFSHTLGESSIAFFAPTDVAARIRRRFPSSLDGAPMVLPPSNTMLRRTLDQWFDARAIHPRIIGEFEDPALMKAVGADAGAIFPAPAAIARDVSRIYGVRQAGRTDEVVERYFAISVERRIRHPGVAALTSAAREDVFATD
ncbi:MAG: transcriptional activator NhaR [Vicinamibacterales bacterium]